MSNFIHSKHENGATILFLVLLDGTVYYESKPLQGCDAILQEGERITKEYL